MIAMMSSDRIFCVARMVGSGPHHSLGVPAWIPDTLRSLRSLTRSRMTGRKAFRPISNVAADTSAPDRRQRPDQRLLAPAFTISARHRSAVILDLAGSEATAECRGSMPERWRKRASAGSSFSRTLQTMAQGRPARREDNKRKLEHDSGRQTGAGRSASLAAYRPLSFRICGAFSLVIFRVGRMTVFSTFSPPRNFSAWRRPSAPGVA